ncbi:MAG: hypothetical protein JWQ29_3102 [Phenylobacterium sp.]|nr:hypothetical protein [Phenylobacterium sp.]
MNLEQVFPHARPWVESLANTFPGSFVKPQFAWWEVLHILSLVTLGGASILMNLRLIGVGLTREPPSEIYRSLKTLQTVGVVGIVVTGLLIGSANAERLYDSTAFIVKMLALAAGVILTYGASRPVARADGAVGAAAKAWFAIGVAVWLAALWVFATGDLISPGVFHVITAAALIVAFATRGRGRLLYLGVLIALIGLQFVWTHFVVRPDDYVRLDPVNIAFAWIFSAWIVGTALFQLFRAGRVEAGGPLTRLIGYAAILVWVTAAAAGRWIAFA